MLEPKDYQPLVVQKAAFDLETTTLSTDWATFPGSGIEKEEESTVLYIAIYLFIYTGNERMKYVERGKEREMREERSTWGK